MASVHDVETVHSGAERVRLAAAGVLALAGFVAFFLLSKQGGLVQWAALLVAFAAAAGVFLTTEPGRRLIAFGRESWREVQKVVWPSRKESLQVTGYVFAFVVVMALFLWLTDKTLEWLLYDWILGWRK